MNSKAIRKQLLAAVAMVLVAAVALGSSTYAWFVNNTTVTAESVTVTAQAANNLLITHGDGTTGVSYGTLANLTTAALTAMKPTSTIGADTAADMTASFFKDQNWNSDSDGEYRASTFIPATENTDFYHDQVTLKASQPSTLFLDDTTGFTGNDDVNKTLRLALVVKGKGVSTYDGAYFYEVDNGALTSRYNTTSTTVASDAEGIKKAISGTSAVSAIACKNVTGTGIPTLEAMSVSTPSNNAMGSGTSEQALYAFKAADDTVTIDIYVWMEGCDVDCNSTVVKSITEKTVTAILGFCVGTVS